MCVAIIRAAAKNYKNVAVLTDPNQYDKYMNATLDDKFRKALAYDAFVTTSKYDNCIAHYFSKTTTTNDRNYTLGK